jgi:hypothetical protein
MGKENGRPLRSGKENGRPLRLGRGMEERTA